MASTGVRLGTNAVVRIGVGVGPTWITLTGCEDVTFPNRTPADVDVTSMDSPNFSEEYISGLFSSPDWTITKHYVPEDAEDVVLSGLEVSRAAVLLEITPPGATVPHTWQGYVKSWVPTMPVKDAMKAELMLKINSKVVA